MHPLSKANTGNVMRYFVYFFNVKDRFNGIFHPAHSCVSEVGVPSWKEVRKKLSAGTSVNTEDLSLTGFHEFANEQDYKDFCG